MHAFISAPTPESLKKAMDKISGLLYLAVECPEAENELKRIQLRELAALNGTLREEDVTRCKNCGNIGHRHYQCPEQKNFTSQATCEICGGIGHLAMDCKFKRDPESLLLMQTPETKVLFVGLLFVVSFFAKAKIDSEYMSLMAELGERPSQMPGQPPAAESTSSSLPWAKPSGGVPSAAPWENRAPAAPSQTPLLPWAPQAQARPPPPPPPQQQLPWAQPPWGSTAGGPPGSVPPPPPPPGGQLPWGAPPMSFPPQMVCSVHASTLFDLHRHHQDPSLLVLTSSQSLCLEFPISLRQWWCMWQSGMSHKHKQHTHYWPSKPGCNHKEVKPNVCTNQQLSHQSNPHLVLHPLASVDWSGTIQSQKALA